jgi:hypothetical protein|tara:strand:- start:966 stop:1433 length:468 start_codon:yes stop_codon:yes gene_type:complete
MKIELYEEVCNNNKIIYNVNFLNTNIDYLEETFENFIQKWRELYSKKIKFCFKFNTCEIESGPISYCYRFSNFIKELKSEPIQYLQFSVISIKNEIIRYLLDIILSIQKPVAPIYITKSESESNELLNYILTNNVLLESFILINKITLIKPDPDK